MCVKVGNSSDSHEIDNHEWQGKTLCIIGDSIINGLDEKRLQRNGIKVKVRCFPGSTINDV